jgi:hypothetical protein
MIPAELLTKYGVHESDAVDAVEMAITRALTAAFRKTFIVRISSRLEITTFTSRGEPVAIAPEEINRKLRRHILFLASQELQKRQKLQEAAELKELRGTAITGEITRIADNGTLLVTSEIIDGFRHLMLNGECPVVMQPPHERERYRIGDVRDFLITSILPVTVNGRQSMVRVSLSRNSKELPALLLQERTGIYGIVCRRRIAGGFSTIITPTRIPKEAINHVGKELGEHLNVSIAQDQRR